MESLPFELLDSITKSVNNHFSKVCVVANMKLVCSEWHDKLKNVVDEDVVVTVTLKESSACRKYGVICDWVTGKPKSTMLLWTKRNDEDVVTWADQVVIEAWVRLTTRGFVVKGVENIKVRNGMVVTCTCLRSLKLRS